MALYSYTLNLYPKPPFDFQQTLSAFLNLHESMGDSKVNIQDNCYSKALMVRGKIIGVKLYADSSAENTLIEEPALICQVYSEQHLFAEDMTRLREILEGFLNLDDDLNPFIQVGAADPVFQPVLNHFHGYHPIRFPSAFEAACWALFTQRNLPPLAMRMKENLLMTLGGVIHFNNTLHIAFPEPTCLANTSLKILSDCIEDPRRAMQVHELAKIFTAVKDDFFQSASDERLLYWLSDIPGIGPSSALYILNWGFGRMQHAPLKEKKMAAVFKKIYGAKDIENVAAQYTIWQGYWAHYLRAFETLPTLLAH